jgi:hypothetical protein
MARNKRTARAETTTRRADLAALRTDIEALRADTERRFTHLESKLESEIDQKPNVTTIFLTMLTGALAIVIVVIVAAALMSL